MDVFTVVKQNRIVFPLACFAAAAMVFISEASFWQSTHTLNQLRAAGATRTSIQDLQLGVLDAESGQRGYLLTGRKEYLQTYETALSTIADSLQLLDAAYREEPKSLEALQQLHSLTRSKLSELALTIRLHDEGRGSASLDLVLSDIGKEKMEAIQKLSAQLMELETTNVAAGRDALYRTLMLSRSGLAALSAICLLALFMYLRQTFALKQHQNELQQRVQLERNRLEIEVAQRTAQLMELTHHLQTAREDERNRLARNLHDDLGALLTAAKLDAARIKSRVASAAPEALELLAHLVASLNASVALGRSIIEDLRPSALSNLGLVATLEILAREFAELTGVQVHGAFEPVALDASAELMIYRLVQEATTNISKYANAKNVWLSLSQRDGQVEVSVRDDGVGFDTRAPLKTAFGLRGMRFRVQAEGGSLNLVSAPGQGTLIQARLPAMPGASPTEPAPS